MARATSYPFKHPLLAAFFSFCLFAAQYAPTAYAQGSPGMGRVRNIIYFAFVLLAFLNYFYLVGYMERMAKEQQANLSEGFLVHCAYVASIFAVVFLLSSVLNLKQHSSFAAARDLYNGTAKQYALEQNERYQVLHDDNIKQVEFSPLSATPELLFFGDIKTDAKHWLNLAVAQLYNKEYVVLKENNQ
jgi:hypothetical protein